jgi:hypothetical protein
MPDVNLPVGWIGQEQLYYCGPAVAQMMLTALNVAPPAQPPTWQDRLWADIQANTGAVRPPGAGPGTPTSPPFPTQKCERCKGVSDWHCWSSTPDALQAVLNLHQHTVAFAVRTHADENAATGHLLDTVDANVAGIVLVFGWQHWVIVRGYDYDEPDSCSVPGHNLNGVHIRDPQVDNPLHFVDCVNWRDNYLRVVPCGMYQNQYVTITGPRQPGAPFTAPSAPTNIRVMSMGPEASIEVALRAAYELLRRSSRWNPGLESAEPQQPLVVQRLDRNDDYYHIVPFTRRGRVTARMIIDSRESRFSEIAAIESPDQSLPIYVGPGQFIEASYDRVIDLPHVYTRVIRRGTVGVHPVLVWKPCYESSTPWLPFYQYSVGDQFVYVRIDGHPFERLTTGPA